MKNLVITLLSNAIFITWLPASAQFSTYDFYEDGFMLKFNVRYATIKTYGIPEDSVVDPSAFLLRILDFDKIKPGIGAHNSSHRWAFLPETFFALLGAKIKSSSSISDFIFGWHNHTFNVVFNNKASVAPGFHWGDYFLSYAYINGNGFHEAAKAPSGWYGALGPAFAFDYNVFNIFVLHLEASYAFSVKLKDAPDMEKKGNYPVPYFLNIYAQIRSNLFVYGGVEYIRSFNRNREAFNASRLDFFIGVWF